MKQINQSFHYVSPPVYYALRSPAPVCRIKFHAKGHGSHLAVQLPPPITDGHPKIAYRAIIK